MRYPALRMAVSARGGIAGTCVAADFLFLRHGACYHVWFASVTISMLQDASEKDNVKEHGGAVQLCYKSGVSSNQQQPQGEISDDSWSSGESIVREMGMELLAIAAVMQLWCLLHSTTSLRLEIDFWN